MTTITDSAAKTSASAAEALLKAAVSGGKAAEAAIVTTAAAAAGKMRLRVEPLMLGLAGTGLALGLALGAGGALMAGPRPENTGLVLAEINAALESSRLEASRLALASDRLDKSIAALKDASEAARSEAKLRSTALTERVGKVETALATKISALGERIDQAEKEQGARLAATVAQVEKRSAAAVAPPVPAPKPEPVQTGSITEAKPKPAVIESWAVRDVYDGTAMLEDRRRRLVEVTVGDSIPGIGRVDSVERRGREWVVTTRQGLVTPQPW